MTYSVLMSGFFHVVTGFVLRARHISGIDDNIAKFTLNNKSMVKFCNGK